MKKIGSIVVGALFGSFLMANTVVAQDSAEDEGPKLGFSQVTMTAADLVGAQQAEGFQEIIDPNEDITWQIYVPKNYSPGNPPGVLVWVSPSGYGGPPLDFNEVLEKKNLIWVGARDAGNNAIGSHRMLKAMLAVPMISRMYPVNVFRTYVAGFSGGGKTAMLLSMASPETFKGGIYMAGALSVGERNPPKLEQVKENRHVFIVGQYDEAIRETLKYYKEFKKAGVENSEMITVPKLRHTLPSPGYFTDAIDYLEEPLNEEEGG